MSLEVSECGNLTDEYHTVWKSYEFWCEGVLFSSLGMFGIVQSQHAIARITSGWFRVAFKHRMHRDAALGGYEEANFQSDVGDSLSHRYPVGSLYPPILHLRHDIIELDNLWIWRTYILTCYYILQFSEVCAFQIVKSLFMFILQNIKVIKMQLNGGPNSK